ncbi:hypothetical protein H8E07_15115 [bacterium]|nr:hypothetical protein [bacterium]
MPLTISTVDLSAELGEILDRAIARLMPSAEAAVQAPTPAAPPVSRDLLTLSAVDDSKPTKAILAGIGIALARQARKNAKEVEAQWGDDYDSRDRAEFGEEPF